MSETVDYPAPAEPDSRLLTILIADVRGYSTFTQDHGDEAGARLASVFADLAHAVVRDAGGTILEIRGDEALAVFSSARKAARAAIDLQTRCAETAERDPSLPLRIGIGLDAGEVVPVGEGYRGRALNVAARLCDLAGPGETLVGEGLVHLAGVVEGLAFVSRGRKPLKGISTVRVYQLARAEDMPERLPSAERAPVPERSANAASGGDSGATLANVAGGMATVVIFIELLVSSHSGGMLFRDALAGVACLAGFAGARLARLTSPLNVGTLFLVVTVALVLTLGWVEAIPAFLFLIAAGMTFFGGHDSAH